MSDIKGRMVVILYNYVSLSLSLIFTDLDGLLSGGNITMDEYLTLVNGTSGVVMAEKLAQAHLVYGKSVWYGVRTGFTVQAQFNGLIESLYRGCSLC